MLDIAYIAEMSVAPDFLNTYRCMFGIYISFHTIQLYR